MTAATLERPTVVRQQLFDLLAEGVAAGLPLPKPGPVLLPGWLVDLAGVEQPDQTVG